MPLETAIKGMDEAKQLGVEWVSLTGGEPFLESRLLTRLVAYSNSLGLKTEAVSNGFWAVSERKADEVLQPLIDSGLCVLNLSLDEFHFEYVDPDKIRTAYHASVDLGLKTTFLVSYGKEGRFSTDTLKTLLSDAQIQIIGEQRVENPNAVVFQTQFTPIGRGASIHYSPVQFNQIRCSEALVDIGLSPNGDVLPCCGPLGSTISLGNILEMDLESILSNAAQDPRFKALSSGLHLDGEYSSRCHACVENWVGEGKARQGPFLST